MAKKEPKRAIPLKTDGCMMCCLGHQHSTTFAVILAIIGLWFVVRDLGHFGGPTSNLLMWPLIVFVTGVALWVHSLK